MSDTYTPTTEEVRGDYAHFQTPSGKPDVTAEYAKGRAEFDRWLAVHDAQVRAEVLAPIIAARSGHPACDVHPNDDDPVSCGWKRAVHDIDAALAVSAVHDEGETR